MTTRWQAEWHGRWAVDGGRWNAGKELISQQSIKVEAALGRRKETPGGGRIRAQQKGGHERAGMYHGATEIRAVQAGRFIESF